MKTNLNCPKCFSLSVIKKGYFKTKYNHQSVPRYKCKTCNHNFSSHTSRETYGQHRPNLNQKVFELASSSVTMRRMAIVLKCARNTIERKLEFIRGIANQSHEIFLSQHINKTVSTQFDEMETYEKTKCKPLSVAIAVDNESGDILDAQVAKMCCKGRLASISRFKYPYWNEDTREIACLRVMETIKKICGKTLSIASDSKKAYPNIIKSVLPDAKIIQTLSRKSEGFDPLFQINHLSAKIRADLARMRRKTWACTKKWQNLQRHLEIYIAWNNGYDMRLNWC